MSLPIEFYFDFEKPGDAPFVENLLDRCFGTARGQRDVNFLRQGAPLPELSLVVRREPVEPETHPVASIRYWPIRIGDAEAVLLGPLAVSPACQGVGIGVNLIAYSLAAAQDAGWATIVVAGPPALYRRFGFQPLSRSQVFFQGDTQPLQILRQSNAAPLPMGEIQPLYMPVAGHLRGWVRPLTFSPPPPISTSTALSVPGGHE